MQFSQQPPPVQSGGPLSHKGRKEEEGPAAGMQFSAFFGGKKQTPPPAAVARPESKNSGVLRSICFAREREKTFFSVSAQQIQGHVLKTCVPAFSFPPFVAGTVANSPFSPAGKKRNSFISRLYIFRGRRVLSKKRDILHSLPFPAKKKEEE